MCPCPHDVLQAGLNWVGLAVPSGRVTPEDMIEVARICDEHSAGDIRLTAEQVLFEPPPSHRL